MADEPTAANKPAARRKSPPGVRFFRGPEVTLVRMGREVATWTGSYGRLDLGAGRVDFREGVMRVGDAELRAPAMTVDLPGRVVTGLGGVRLAEQGVEVSADRVRARLALSGLRFGGAVRLSAKDRESAQALLDAGVM
jgi:hypothetical protein